MDEATLIRRLEAFEAPGIEDSRHRARREIPLRLRRGSPPVEVECGTGAHRLRLAAALLAVALVLTAGALFTPPGRAVTEWVGDQIGIGIGIGQPGGHPSLRRLRHFADEGTAGQGQPAYVLAVGPTLHGNRYEFVVYHPKAPPGKHWHVEGPCFELDLPQERSLTGQGCGVLPEGRNLYAGFGGNADPDQEIHYVTGRTSMAVESVVIRFDGHRVPVELQPIPDWLTRRLHLGRRFRFFFAVVPNALARHGGNGTVTALGRNGESLGEKAIDSPDPAPMFRFMCHNLERRTDKKPGAVADCRRELGPGPW